MSPQNLAQPADSEQPAEIERVLRVLHPPGAVFELRALAVPKSRGGDYRATWSGYYSDPAAAAAAAATLDLAGAEGVYLTVNEIDPALLARAENRGRFISREPTTADHDVRRRRWLPIDIDAVRVKGVSATAAELESALELAAEVRRYLREEDWPEPVQAASGNGAHLLYRIDLPTDDGGLTKAVLAELANRFNSGAAKVDTSVYNPARIWKLYGTTARKGDSTDERPHRRAGLRCMPAELEPVTEAQLRAFAAVAVAEPAVAAEPRSTFEIDTWIAMHLPEAGEPQPYTGNLGTGRRWILKPCPLNSDHSRGEAALIAFDSGPISASCRHESCRLDWRTLRELREPGCYDGSAADGTYERIKASAERQSVPVSPTGDRPDDPALVLASTVEPEQIDWHWPGRIAVGKITLVSGDPGTGKSVATLDIAARFSAGAELPVTGEQVSPSGVIILGVEDGAADTVVPRLIAAGADLDRVHLWMHREGSPDLPRFPGDVDELRRHLETSGARLLVIDPLNAFVDAKLDVHKDQHVRLAMAPLARALEESGCSALIVRHLNKKAGASAMHRGGGSIAITGVARVELLVGDHPSDDGVKVVASVKANIAVGAPSLGFTIGGSEPYGAAKLTWVGEVSANAEDLVEVQRDQAWARQGAEEFLREMLRDGPLDSKEIRREAKHEGFAGRTLDRAKAALGVESFRTGFGAGGSWSWRLPRTGDS